MKEIGKLSPKEQKQLFQKLGLRAAAADKQRGGPSDPFSRLIGKIDGPGTGSRHYKDKLYGGKAPSKLFIDASGFIALCDKNDAHHEEAAAFAPR